MLSDSSASHPLLGYVVYGPLWALTLTFTSTTLTCILGPSQMTVRITPDEYATLLLLDDGDWRGAWAIFRGARARERAQRPMPSGL